MANRKRNIQMKFYVTEEEKRLIDEKMKLLPTQRYGAYLRKMAISELTPELLWLFIERIEIGARPAPYDRNGMQDIRIIYRDIGLVDSPVQTNESDTVPSLEDADQQMTVQDRLVS